MSLSLTLLGTGSSGGVPRLGPDWGVCDPAEPRNRRMRCSALFERHGHDAKPTSVLIDTAPDFREQALRAGINRLDAVLYSHDHADQAHGIDDLRMIAGLMRRRVPVFMDEATASVLTRRFDYCFEGFPAGGYPPIIEDKGRLIAGQSTKIDGPGGEIAFDLLDQDHGAVRSIGFRAGGIAYCNDVVDMPEASLTALEGVDVFVIDALRYTPHPTHAHLERALGWAARLKPQLTVLTNLHIDMDYRTLERELPEGVIPGYDGLFITLDGESIHLSDRFSASHHFT